MRSHCAKRRSAVANTGLTSVQKASTGSCSGPTSPHPRRTTLPVVIAIALYDRADKARNLRRSRTAALIKKPPVGGLRVLIQMLCEPFPARRHVEPLALNALVYRLDLQQLEELRAAAFEPVEESARDVYPLPRPQLGEQH